MDRIIVEGCPGGCRVYLEGNESQDVLADTADEGIGSLALNHLLADDALVTAIMEDNYWLACFPGESRSGARGRGRCKYQAVGDFLRNHGEYLGFIVVTR